jgi:hypothetical protein
MRAATIETLTFTAPGNLHDIEAEEAILGGILLDPEAIGRVIDLTPETFYISAHQEIYRASLELFQAGKPTDLLHVASKLGDRGSLARVGGRVKLAQLVDRTVSAVNIDSLAALVTEKYLRRQLVEAGQEIARLGQQPGAEVSHVIQQLNLQLDRSRNTDLVGQRQKLEELVSQSQQRLDLRKIFHPHLGALLHEKAESLPVAAEYLMQPFLSICAGILGTKAGVQIKRGWTEPAIVWTGLVGDPGTMKSPAIAAIHRPLVEMQKRAKEDWELRYQEWQQQSLVWDGMSREERAERPEAHPGPAPQMRHYYLDQATMEALIEKHVAEPSKTGFSWVMDELASLLPGLDQYKAKGKGNSRQTLLALWTGGALKSDRVTKELFIPRSSVSVTGGIQQKVLKRLMEDPSDPDGLWGRFLWSSPPTVPDRWVEDECAISEMLVSLYDRLDKLPETTYALSPEAKSLYAWWVDWLAQEKETASDALKNVLSKLKGYLGRIALLLHCIDTAFDPALPFSDVIEQGTLMRAIDLCWYYLGQAKLLYADPDAAEVPQELVKIVSLAQKNGQVSDRDIVQRKWGKAEQARDWLRQLGRLGYRILSQGTKGMRLIFRELLADVGIGAANVSSLPVRDADDLEEVVQEELNSSVETGDSAEDVVIGNSSNTSTTEKATPNQSGRGFGHANILPTIATSAPTSSQMEGRGDRTEELNGE